MQSAADPPPNPDSRRHLILLGTGTSHGVPMIGCGCPTCTSTDPRNHRTRTGAVLEAPDGNLLIDTPPELRLQLLRERIGRVHAVLFTHGHADHLFGLDDLRLFPHYLGRALPAYCEPELERQIRSTFAYAFDPATADYPAGWLPQIEFRTIGLQPFVALGQRVVPIRLHHGKSRVLGFRFDDVAFCTDVNEIPPESWPLLEGLDVLVLDCLRERPHPTHFGLSECLDVIARLKPRQTYLTHISHSLEHASTNARLPDCVELAYDGLRIPLEGEG